MLSRHGSWRHVGRGATAALVALLGSDGRPSAAEALDWPQFLGPERNGVYRGPALAKAWPAEGPAVVWKRSVGQGFSGPVISSGRLVLHHRVGAKAVVECLDARTGRELWQAGHSTDYRDDFGFDEGPRATPAIAGGRVFTFGAEGRLSRWSLADGAAVWSVDTQRELGSPKGFFGRACSPLVESNLVVLNPATMPRVWNIEGASMACTAVRIKDASCVAWSCEPAKSAGASRA